MSRIVLTEELLAQLRATTEPVKLCDAAGQIVGEFFPKLNPADWEAIGPELSAEELLDRVRNDKKFTTEQVLEFLRQLP
jgi:Asp-tRNA(Asn)/Glu-tRNA(Gln) amidotransferase C subunit